MRTILRFAFLAALAFTLAPPAAPAQAYPAKPVRLMIPWPAGGSTDIVGRIVFQHMSASMGQQFVGGQRELSPSCHRAAHADDEHQNGKLVKMTGVTID